MTDLPARVTELLKSLNSIEQVAVLMLLSSDPTRAWTIHAISRELRSVESAVRLRLDDLYISGVLLPSLDADRVAFTPTSVEMAAAIAETLEAYRQRPNRIIELIHSTPR